MTLSLRETMISKYPDLNKAIFYDDFMGANYDNETWYVAGTGTVPPQVNLGGVIKFIPDIRKDFSIFMTGPEWSVAANLQFEARIKAEPVAGVANYVEFGVQQSPSGADYCGFRTTNDVTFPNFGGVCNGIYYDSGVARDTNWHTFKFTCSTGLIHWYLDGVRFGTRTATLPANVLAPFLYVASGQKLISAAYIDYFLLTGDRV